MDILRWSTVALFQPSHVDDIVIRPLRGHCGDPLLGSGVAEEIRVSAARGTHIDPRSTPNQSASEPDLLATLVSFSVDVVFGIDEGNSAARCRIDQIG